MRRSSSAAPVSISKAWDYRVRQHLGTRYDSKKGCFDWDLTMKLHEKGVTRTGAHTYYFALAICSHFFFFFFYRIHSAASLTSISMSGGGSAAWPLSCGKASTK